jgi:hypothetical protein
MDGLHRLFTLHEVNHNGDFDFTGRNHVNVHAFPCQRFKKFSRHASVTFHADANDGQLADFLGGYDIAQAE